MKVIIHDLGPEYEALIEERCGKAVAADGKYAPCQGCFHCWTKSPAACEMKDALQEICRVIGQADDLTIITENWYGGYSPAVKNLLDRSIGTSTPMSTYRGWEMHHTLRYGKHHQWRVVVYGDTTDGEKKTWALTAKKNAINDGFQQSEVSFVTDINELEANAL